MRSPDSNSPVALRSVDETRSIIARRLAAGDWSPQRIAAEIHTAADVPIAIAPVPADAGSSPIYDQLAHKYAVNRMHASLSGALATLTAVGAL